MNPERSVTTAGRCLADSGVAVSYPRPLPMWLLKEPVGDLPTAKRWLQGLVLARATYHLEDDPGDVHNMGSGENVFYQSHVELIRRRAREVLAAPWGSEDYEAFWHLMLYEWLHDDWSGARNAHLHADALYEDSMENPAVAARIGEASAEMNPLPEFIGCGDNPFPAFSAAWEEFGRAFERRRAEIEGRPTCATCMEAWENCNCNLNDRIPVLVAHGREFFGSAM